MTRPRTPKKAKAKAWKPVEEKVEPEPEVVEARELVHDLGLTPSGIPGRLTPKLASELPPQTPTRGSGQRPDASFVLARLATPIDRVSLGLSRGRLIQTARVGEDGVTAILGITPGFAELTIDGLSVVTAYLWAVSK